MKVEPVESGTADAPRKVSKLRRLQGLPQQIYVQVMDYACEARADGQTLEEIETDLGERFHVSVGKSLLSYKFRKDSRWADLVKDRAAKVDASLASSLWIYRRAQRLRRLQDWVERLEKKERYMDAARILHQVAKELGQIGEKSWYEYLGTIQTTVDRNPAHQFQQPRPKKVQ